MRYGLALLILGLGFNFSAQAQVMDSTAAVESQLVDSTHSGKKITLQEAISIALKNSYQLKQARNNLDLADRQVLGAKADFLPSISGQVNGTKTIGQQFNQTTVSFNNVTTNNVSGGINASLPLFQGFRNIVNLRRSHINEDYEQVSKKRTRETVIFNAASGFLQVVLNRQLLKIARENLVSSRQQLKQVKAQVEVGSVPSVDRYNQEATVASDELTVTQRKNDLSYSKTQLIGTLQLNIEKDYWFAAPDVEDFNPVPTSLNLSDLIDQALANRNDLKAQKLLIKRNRKDLGLSRANYYPTISANAAFNTRYNDQYRLRKLDPNDPQNTIIQKVGFGEQFFDQNINKYFGISINVPIFNNLTTRLNVQTAKINYRNSQLEYQNLKYSVLQEVRQAYNDYRSYAIQLGSTAKALKAAQKSYVTQKERYNVGAGTLIELSDANAQYVQAQSNRAQAVLRFVFQKKLLNYYLGNISENISL